MDRCDAGLDNSNMPKPAAERLPAYALYGEAEAVLAGDPLHCESIAERSRLHGWEIRPHRHETLFQLLWVARGRCVAALDGRTLALVGPGVLTVPPLAAHGFRFSPEVDGLVFTIDERHLRALLAPALAEALMQLHGWPLRERKAVAELRAASRALRQELQAAERWRACAVDAALQRLAVAAARSLPLEPAAGVERPERALGHVQRFRALVELHFRQQPTLAALAARLAITPTQLNRVCHQVLGHAALGVLHQRLVLEAQRDLAYTAMSVKQIALALGFADAAYFTRFFRRCTGQTPTAWRAASAGYARDRTGKETNP
jgi:AraC family transcriptional activator of pobA